MALSPVHNKFLTDLATNNNGEVALFLPAVAFILIIVGTGFFLLNKWDDVRRVGWGSKAVTIPLYIIIGAMALSGINADGFTDKFAPLFMGVSLFGLYLVARVVGKDIFFPLAVGAAIASVGVIIHGVVYPGNTTGGLIFENNFDIFTGYALLGFALFFHKWRWLLAGLALIALFFSGSPEALLPVGVLGIAILVRRDWDRRALWIAVSTALLAILLLAAGPGRDLYSYAWAAASNKTTVSFTDSVGVEHSGSPITWRLETIQRAMSDIRPLGDGYNVTGFTTDTVHNVPLILVQQMGYPGMLAALAWLFLCLWGFFKTKWKYVWLLVASLCLFDHYLWDQLNPLFWCILGASAVTSGGTDLIFKQESAVA